MSRRKSVLAATLEMPEVAPKAPESETRLATTGDYRDEFKARFLAEIGKAWTGCAEDELADISEELQTAADALRGCGEPSHARAIERCTDRIEALISAGITQKEGGR